MESVERSIFGDPLFCPLSTLLGGFQMASLLSFVHIIHACRIPILRRRQPPCSLLSAGAKSTLHCSKAGWSSSSKPELLGPELVGIRGDLGREQFLPTNLFLQQTRRLDACTEFGVLFSGKISFASFLPDNPPL